MNHRQMMKINSVIINLENAKNILKEINFPNPIKLWTTDQGHSAWGYRLNRIVDGKRQSIAVFLDKNVEYFPGVIPVSGFRPLEVEICCVLFFGRDEDYGFTDDELSIFDPTWKMKRTEFEKKTEKFFK